MKRIFIFSVLMIAFVMNAVAWEPVIKETHWFGMHEYYTSTDPTFNVGDCLDNTDFSSLTGWTANNAGYYTTGVGIIGEYSITLGSEQQGNLRVFSAGIDGNHSSSDNVLCLETRWSNGKAQYTQTTKQPVEPGTYRLVFDVYNDNDATENHNYENLFYVQVGNGNPVYDSKTEWMSSDGSKKWTTHIIEVWFGGVGVTAQNITISLGYGTGNNNEGHPGTPALFISNLEFKRINGSNIESRTISSVNNDQHTIESIEVVKGWTGQDPAQRPKTSFYSWINRQPRFSVNRALSDGVWTIDSNNSRDYEGFGLKNTAATAFKILNLQAGDKFSVEYYLDSYDSAIPYLANGNNEMTGSVEGMSPDQGEASYIESKVDYTMATAGNVQILMPANAVIRSITITYPNERYQKAEVEVDELTTAELQSFGSDASHVGYRYSFSSPGVLEDKRGAVPYITMKFGHDNDMTFVRNVGSPGNGVTYYAAASIIDESNDFDPDGANLQAPYHPYSAAQMKDRLAGKEWSVFTAEQNNDGGDDFNTIYPLYGSYFYFFPEVNGRLVVEFYCEGSEENAPIWYKETADGGFPPENGLPQPWLDDTFNLQRIGFNNANRTSGSNFYRYILDVERGGIYYLCSLPTNIAHEHPIVRLISYSFIPDFRMAPLYKVVNNSTDIAYDISNPSTGGKIDNVAEIFGGPYSNLDTNNLTGTYIRNKEPEDRVKCLGNVASAKVKVTTQGTSPNEHQYLSFYDIHFKNEGTAACNPGGAIVAHINNEYGQASFVLTIAYDAAKAKWNDDMTQRVPASNGGQEVKQWDFYSGDGEKDVLGTGHGWDVGKYGEGDYPLYDPDKTFEQNQGYFNSPKLWKETHKADGLTADWSKTYVNLLNGGEEPIFKSVYDMEYDNADMLHETAGLVFKTDANELGIWNENDDPENDFQDRYVGLMGGGKLIIPRLKQNDRVVIKMGSFGNADDDVDNQDAIIRLTNAKDAKGNPISSNADYIIGGSMPYTDETGSAKTQPHGEYHFQVAADGTNEDNDFAIEVQDNTELLKIYSIVIYRNGTTGNDNADILTENSVTGLDPEILFTSEDEDESTKDITCYMRYSGYKETSTFNGVDQVRGNLSVNTDGFGDVTGPAESYPYYTVTAFDAVTKGDFGSFRAQMAVKTKDDDNTYVTDYAPGSLAVGYLETMDYPYTWDFTDLLTVTNGYVSNAIGQEEEAEDSSLLPDYKGWKENSGSNLRNAPEEEPGVLFANGGQLYAANVMFKETAGLGFKRSTDDVDDAKKQNESVCIAGGTTGVLEVDNVTYSDRFVKIVIPKVPANAAIYMRATPIARATVKAQYSKDGETSDDMTVSDVTFPANSTDKIYVMKNTDEQDVELWLNGLAIKKIAVSTAPKKLNTKGWASESREYVTDPALASYMTGKDIRTYIVSKVDYPNKQVTLERIDARSDESNFSGYLMPAAEDGDNNACVILNYKSGTGGELEGEQVKILDGGFHLFVPDMHDKTKATWSSVNKTNILVSQVSGSEDSPAEIPAVSNGFTNFAFTCKYYDIDPDKGTIVNNTPHDGPQAFYRIAGGENGKATSKGHQGYLPIKIEKTTTGNSAGARFSLVIVDGDEITGVSSLESVTEDNGRFYNLNGQQLDGIPNRSGLYIVNGKKVYIKNK